MIRRSDRHRSTTEMSTDEMKGTLMRVLRNAAMPIGLAAVLVFASAVSSAGAANTAAGSKSVSGKIVQVVRTSSKLTLKVGKAMDTIYWNSKTKVIAGSKPSSISALKSGEQATVKYSVSSGKWLASGMSIGAVGLQSPV